MTETANRLTGGHAAADKGTGVSMPRIYTTPGVHPYDEVTWELRDVVQTNWKTGETIFEQHGVEFPDFWSVNAGAIVTTKYFRGALGTETRERSLRQLIDRVVLTYVKAGKEHGYFATDDDAEVFEHELTYALLHQVFSFNSPVWFNVGTRSPQQVSACFILSVDDSMDSILNWYKEEGKIFKGGSGAGLNLSRIRASTELLSSGGAASGPVSFMRGADASAGTIKSGGATRRAAKMVVLDVDHPDIEEFIDTKAREEDKIRALRDAGFDMDLGGRDIVSVQYQNANNSVRVTDEFMRAVEDGTSFGLRGRLDGQVTREVDARALFDRMAKAAWECADPGIQYDDTINDWHTSPETGRITASNPCSEYMSLDNSSCNLASLNLLKFLRDDDTFDAATFQQVVELIVTAMDISICFADFPTEAITVTTRDYRQLGIGYANLGALLMATGHGYDSASGRSLAASITSLLTGAAYKRSAELAAVVGPYAGYARNAQAHQRIMRKHQAANDTVRTLDTMDRDIHQLATKAWDQVVTLGAEHGFRNAQASVLAPTGCLTGDTLVTTDRGLQRLSDLGNVWGDRWQDVQLHVSTDEGPQRATKFFVNGEEPTRDIVTTSGYHIQGTLAHRVKVIDDQTGSWQWKRLAEIAVGDVVPIQLGTLVGEPRQVPLPVLDQTYDAGDRTLHVPTHVDTELAELVGYFMGDGSLHADGLRLRVAGPDADVVSRIEVLSKGLFNLTPVVRAEQGQHDVTLPSVRLARWWQAAGFANDLPGVDHAGNGWTPRVPAAILESNDRGVYAAFLRGLFEAAGAVLHGVPSVSISSATFADEVRTILLTLGYPTTTRTTDSGDRPVQVVQLRDLDHLDHLDHTVRFGTEIGFLGGRKSSLVATDLVEHTGDARLGHTPGYLYETVAANNDGGVQPTYDLSVPANVTYVAAGFVSHNTIGFMMDCDTTGVEPDFSLVKFKKLVGGGSMQIVNLTIPRALTKLGYQQEQIEAIVEYIADKGHVIDAPGLKPEHYEVFDCAMGARAISPMGHVRMMAACQPFLSGAISKTVNLPETATVEEIADVYMQGWKLGLKALAVYRDNCKVGQPLSDAKADSTSDSTSDTENADDAAAAPEPLVQKVVEYRPVRKRLPKRRPSQTLSFSVGGAEGYLTAGSYPDDGLGEIFLKLGKQGSTLAGVMDSFALAISIALQYGVPLETFVEKFTNLRFEPAGPTDDPDVRMASSIMDYVFRRLALDYLDFDTRSFMGIYTAEERARHLETGSYAAPEASDQELADELQASAQSVFTTPVPASDETGRSDGSAGGGEGAGDASGGVLGADHSAEVTSGAGAASAREVGGQIHSSQDLLAKFQGKDADAPMCLTCGTKMRPAGSCYVCEGCGSTSGCS
ncbi:MAG: ribonucleoside-diphosphate reductase, adenosylcobalamin-dependent [Actinomycetales bacterium]|nr:MAG: ribonucleoside-diphosphate reductase, adenosylcobalamin-dependent [Actinomycetales bacterium]